MYSFEEIYKIIKESQSMEEFCKKCGGLQLYIPQVRPDYREKIREEFNGYNEASLATKYNLSIRTVQEIIKDLKPKKYMQASLF